jgi:hypothetical protein
MGMVTIYLDQASGLISGAQYTDGREASVGKAKARHKS